MKKHAHWKHIQWERKGAVSKRDTLLPEILVLLLVLGVMFGFSVTAHSADASWQAQNRQVTELHVSGQDGKALAAAEKALRTAEQTFGPRSAEAALSLNNLALIRKKQGDYEQAAGLYKRSLDIAESLVGEKHPDLLVSFNNLAMTYEAMGKYEEADAIYAKVRARGHVKTAEEMEVRAKAMRRSKA